MNTSEAIDQIAAALAVVQAKIENPEKTKINPHFKNKYADLGDSLIAIRKVLAEAGIALTQMTSFEDGIMVLHTRLIHMSGQWVEGTYPVCSLGKHQDMGSAMTYARRYALFSAIGIQGDEDTDGEGAASAAKAPPKASVKTDKPKAEPPPPQAPEVPPEMMFDPAESASMRQTMVNEINACNDRPALQDWARDNQFTVARLTPKDADIVRAAWGTKQTALNALRVAQEQANPMGAG